MEKKPASWGGFSPDPRCDSRRGSKGVISKRTGQGAQKINGDGTRSSNRTSFLTKKGKTRKRGEKK